MKRGGKLPRVIIEAEVRQPLMEIKLHSERQAKHLGDDVRRLHRPGHW